MAPHSSTLAWKIHGWRSLVGCSPCGREELGTTEWLHFHFSVSCIGEGNGNPLQCSCLESPRDSRAWWAALYRLAQSRTWLKQFSSSSSSSSSSYQSKTQLGWNYFPESLTIKPCSFWTLLILLSTYHLQWLQNHYHQHFPFEKETFQFTKEARWLWWLLRTQQSRQLTFFRVP